MQMHMVCVHMPAHACELYMYMCMYIHMHMCGHGVIFARMGASRVHRHTHMHMQMYRYMCVRTCAFTHA